VVGAPRSLRRTSCALGHAAPSAAVGGSGITGLRELSTGHAGLLAVIEEWTQLLGPPDFTIERVTGLEDGAFATARLRGQGAASGATVDRQVASVFTFSGRGRITRWVSYWNPDEAYAVGLKQSHSRSGGDDEQWA
jgi:SnoaL-like domain